MRTSLTVGLLAATAAATAAAVASPVAAINSYNARPSNRTEVGAFMALWDSDDADHAVDRFDWVCSGTMVDSDTFLTAAHCTDDWPAGTTFYVSLESDVQTPLDDAADDGLSAVATRDRFVRKGWAVQGDTHQDPAFPGNSSDSHDIGVIDFSTRRVQPDDRWTFTPATLPTLGVLGQLGSRTLEQLDWVVAGYGLQEAQTGAGGQTFPGGGVRLEAPEDFDSLNATWVRLKMVESQDLGGACYGDSGGPNFVTIGGKDVLASTTITGDVPCYATNVTYRLDTPSARTFLAPFVALP